MKKLLFILIAMAIHFSISAQPTPIEKNIQKAETLLNDGFPNDAERLSDSSLRMMQCQDRVPLFVKANILYIKAISDYQEDAVQKSILHLENALKQCQSPATEIFHSYLGELYANFSVNTVRKTDVENPDNPESWSAEHVQEKSIEHYRLSLKNAPVLQKQLIDDYKIILTDEKNRMNIMPTLYDVLAVRFFNSCRHRLSIEAHPELLQPLNAFLQIDWTVDENNSESAAVPEFQKLLRFHLNRSHSVMAVMYPKDALIYFDILRLNFFDPNNQKAELKIKALDDLIATYKNESAITLAYFEKAKILNGLPYNVEVGDNRWSKVEAEKVCREAVALFPNSEGAKNCAELIKETQEKSFSVQSEKDLPVNRPALMLVDFQNVATLFFNVYKVSDDMMEQLLTTYQNEAVYKKIIADAQPQLSWDVSLPEQKDYRSHSTEVELPALESGSYLIFCSLTSDLSENSEYSVIRVQVSDLLPMLLQENADKNSLLVVHRMDGNPLKDIQITYYYRENNSFNSKGTDRTDEKGWIDLPDALNRSSLFIKLTSGDDSYWTSLVNLRNYNHSEKEQMVIQLFTDRAIYRPGQTVYYKGIVYRQGTESLRVAANYATQFSVRDPNFQEFFQCQVASDDFGGFNGFFVLPDNMLNGQIYLQAGSSNKTVRIEAYKRPRFEVTMESPTTEFALKDTVEVHGKAMMLNGLPLQNAEVKYTVKRSCYRPWRFFFVGLQEDEIVSGITETQDDGSFSLSFIADPESDDNGKCFYRFSIAAEVLDMTGEMQQSETSIFIGKEPFNIHLSVDDFVVLGENDHVRFDIINTDEKSLPLEATLVVEKLEQPKQIYTERKWDMPELQIFTKKEFEQKFPNYLYEEQKEPAGKEVFRQTFAAEAERTLDLSSLNLTSGSYRITVSAVNKWGEKVEQKLTVKILNINDKKSSLKTNALVKISYSSVKIGDTVTLYYTSGAKDVKMLYTLTTVDGKKEKQWLHIGGKNGKILIPTGDDLKTDFVVKVFVFKDNQCYKQSEYISVIDPKETLSMEISGIRDKTLPGAHEKWQVKILDSEGKPVLASMFAGMYDAALDKFEPHSWSFSPQKLSVSPSMNEVVFGLSADNFRFFNKNYLQTNYQYFNVQNLNWFDYPLWNYYRGRKGDPLLFNASPDAMIEMMDEKAATTQAMGEEADAATGTTLSDESASPVDIRQNFNETAFFYPDVRTDANGALALEFTMPETSTRWNMMGIAYTKSLQTVYYDTVIVTKSDFMVLPNLPRFLRSGDECRLIARIANSSDKALRGTAALQLENPINGKSMNHFVLDEVKKPFEVAAGQSITVFWRVKVSSETDLLQITMLAKSGSMTDGEKHIIPILPNEATTLETVAIELSEAGEHAYALENLGNPNAEPQSLTIECTTNPIWYAIQALPTLTDYQYECTDNIFNALYATILSEHILNSQPEIKQTFDVWRHYDSDALFSNLEQNQELKNILLSETPWVTEAKAETVRQQKLAALYDVNQLNYHLSSNLEKLNQRQMSSGAFIWFPEMGESWFITEYIVNGIGKLNSMQLSNADLNRMAEKAVRYLDAKMLETKAKNPEAVKGHLNYLFARSYFMDVAMDEAITEIFNEIKDYSVKNHTKFGFNNRAKLALSLQRAGAVAEAKKVAASLDNYGLGNKQSGKYWRTQQGSAYASDISLSALMAEVYKNILENDNSLLDVQKYLIRNKRTNEWLNASATADAVYALMLDENRLNQDNPVSFKLGDLTIHSIDENSQAGSGYFKRSFAKSDIKPEMKNILVETTNDNVLFGGIYLQYQIPVDKMAKSKTEDLTVDKKLFVAKIENGKTVYTPLLEDAILKVGDKVVVRLTITSNRDMEYVHLNDMRSGSFEPVESVSRYVWNSDLGYYLDIKDASVNLFFEKVPRGTFVIEYELWATQNGTFSNGFSTVQCLYAPEFSGNSDGTKVKIE